TKHDHMIPLIQYFLDNGVDINVRNPKNRKTIFSTLLTLKTAKFLLDKGADHKIIDADTDTPLISAIENEAANDLIKFLIDIGVYLGTKEYGMPFDTAESKVSDLERQHFDVEFRIRNDDMLESLNVRIDKARKVMRIIEQAIDVQTSESVELLSDELMTPELRLFGYSVVLKNKKFRDILTQNDVQAIIDELKQFQPTDIDKLLHHTENFLIYVDNVKKDIKIETQGKLKEYYLAYDADDGYRPYRISFSPTIDKILLRAKTEHSEMELYYNLDYMREPLFIQLAHTKNDHIIPLIQFFLDNGVDVNMRSQKWGDTIFSSVSTLKMTKFLASNGADPTIVTKDNDTPLIHAINLERSNELIKFLIDIGGLHVRSSDYPAVLDIAKWKVEYLKNKQLDMSDGNEQYASLSARRKKAEEVVRIIEQALEAEKKP
ncbi:MAG: hypothetical protein K0U45_09090, partial [Alphaproteobacteria bacterium]|nr:hypothetical protein [Alphaproteobacteria bacterium]